MPPTPHPRHGPREPSTATPARRPGSVRRTTTHDSHRPDGLAGDIVLVATGRDMRTGPGGESGEIHLPPPRAEVLEVARVEIRIAYRQGRRILALETEPARPALAALVGGGTSSGYRPAVEAALPGERARGSLLFQLLDDVPNALLVNGYAVAIGLPPEERIAVRRGASPGRKVQHPDLCAGWRVGGTIMTGIKECGLPPISRGPTAPDLRVPGDPLAWHALDPPPPLAMRRIRRIDVWPAGGEIAVEAFFRDSHVDADGHEEVVHEYTVHATVDPVLQRFTTVRADIGALPFVECPDAAPSAERLAGVALADLRTTIRTDFTGPTTCTHLNDTLRALEDLPALIAALRPT